MELIIGLILLGVLFYFIEMIPMASPMPQIIKAVVIIVSIVMVAQWLGYDLGLPTLGR